jgi:hypothetical protein
MLLVVLDDNHQEQKNRNQESENLVNRVKLRASITVFHRWRRRVFQPGNKTRDQDHSVLFLTHHV